MSDKGIYYLYFYGEIENDGLATSEFGEQRNYWFHTLEERNKFEEKIQNFSIKHQKTCVFLEKIGVHTWKKTIAVIEMIYNEKTYHLEYSFGYGYAIKDAEYMFKEGNYACDCNRSILLEKKYPQDFPKEFECGDSIIMKSINFKFDE